MWAEYGFRDLSEADLPMVAKWLATPELVRWRGDPAEQLALVTEDLDNPLMDQKLVAYQAQDFAYVQHYPCHAWGAPHLDHFPVGTLAMDACIGVPEMLGHGHGAAFLRQRAAQLISGGAPAVVIDPSPDNIRAVRAYRAAGFIGDKIVPCEDGTPVIVMEFKG